MASLFHIKGRAAWQIAFFDGTGRRRLRSSGTSDRKAAETIAARLEHAASMEREGLVDPRVEGHIRGARTLLEDHVEAFVGWLRDKGSSVKHVADRRRQLRQLLAAMKATRVADLTPARTQRGLAEIRETRGVSLRTLDRHVRAIRALGKWLVRESLVAADPLVGVCGFNADTDRRHERRALTQDELGKLLDAAEAGPTYVGLSGHDRAVVYRLAVGTGFRVSEIKTLTPESFRLDGEGASGDGNDGNGRGGPPTITVKAAYSKNRRESVQPIRRDLADLLRPWLAGKPRGEPVFVVRDLAQRSAMLMKRDLAAAGVPYVDEDGKIADFHALRHTFITEVVRAGASVKEAQTLARHATAELTFRVYAHARLHDLERTLERMPATATAADKKQNVELAG